MKLIETGVRIWAQPVYIQATEDERIDLQNRGALRAAVPDFYTMRDPELPRPELPRPVEYLEVLEPKPEPEGEVDGEETISARLARAWSLYAEGGALGTNTCNFLEVMAAAIAELDARTSRKV